MPYGKVIFKKGGEEGAKLQRTLITRLDAQGVITVPKATIDKWYNEDKMELVGCVHSYKLHNKEEADIFRTVMESEEMQSPYIRWKITRFDHDREFTKWCEETSYYISGKEAELVDAPEKEEKKHGKRKKV